jgi:hypothetical protein
MRVLLLLLLILGLSGSARAQGDGDRLAVQAVIERQLNAFLADDAATAYSFAAPNITARFPTDEIFMEMVRQGYRPVYRPRSWSFGPTRENAGQIEQIVDLVDSEGVQWTARYVLEKQPDGSWKITACYLLKKPGEVAWLEAPLRGAAPQGTLSGSSHP